MSIIFLASCTDSDERTEPSAEEPAFITFGSSPRGGIEWVNARIGTRSFSDEWVNALNGTRSFGDEWENGRIGTRTLSDEWENGRIGTRTLSDEWENGRIGTRTLSDEWENGRAGTRADGNSSASSSSDGIPAATPDDIGVFAFGNGPNTTYVFKNQKVYYKRGEEIKKHSVLSDTTKWTYNEYRLDGNGNVVTDNDDNPVTTLNLWPYTTQPGSNAQKAWERMHYRFFAYSPWSKDDEVSVTAESYVGFNTFQWNNIPGFTAADYMLAHEIVLVDNSGKTRKTPDAVHFQMRHILSRIRFFFKMSPAYRIIRKIELNSITIISAGKVKTATFNFNNSLAWDGTVHWSNEQIGEADPVTLANKDDEHYEIEKEYPAEPFTSVYVYPQSGFNELKMRLDYTVYDSEGVPTREVNNLVNTIVIKDDKGKPTTWNLLSGYYYDIKINIVPTYLYVLSDNDQNFDGYVIIKDSTPPGDGS